MNYPRRSAVNAVAGRDFNGDGKDDWVLHNRETGDVAFSFDGRAVAAITLPKKLAAPWYVVATADVNGDGQSDLVWHNRSTGQIAYWYLQGTTFDRAVTLTSTQAPPWYLASTGDFDGDGKADLLWHHVDGRIAYWYMDNTSRKSNVTLPRGALIPWHLVGTGDFNGDGKTDLLWHDWTSGKVAFWYMNNTTLLGNQAHVVSTLANGALVNAVLPPPWYVVGAGDVNQDGKAELRWQNKLTGQTANWFVNGTETRASSETH